MLSGYSLGSSFCRERGKHGGSAIFHKADITCVERSDLKSFSVAKVIECSAIQMSLKDNKLIIVCIYRPNTPPLSNVSLFLVKLRHILEICCRQNVRLIITGDFNIDIRKSDGDSRAFLSLLEQFNIRVTNMEPTRLVSGACLDNILTNCSGNTCVMEYHMSDHSALKFITRDLLTRSSKTDTILKRRVNQKTVDEFLSRLSKMDWSDIFSTSVDVNQSWNSFFLRFKNIFDLSFPKVRMVTRCPIDSFRDSPRILSLKSTLDVLFVVSSVDAEFTETYKSFKKRYDELISRERKKHFNNFILASPINQRQLGRSSILPGAP